VFSVKCSKCQKEFDEADKKYDYKRLCAANYVPQPGQIGFDKRDLYYPVFGFGIGEFKPLCLGCLK